MNLNEIKPINLREQVVEQVKTAIIEGRLKPGDHMVEATLTRQLGVSRTPLREALILLEREGLVETIPNKGTFVRRFSEKDIEMIFSLRIALENFAAERIIDQFKEDDIRALELLIGQQGQYILKNDFKNVRSLDMRFHRYLIERSEHSLLLRSWSEIVAQIAALLYMRAEAMPSYNENLAISDHQSILEAYQKRNLPEIKRLNQMINDRVAHECLESLARLNIAPTIEKNNRPRRTGGIDVTIS
ncbi:MAG: hypothetical protein GFH24_608416n34 [Chloroflexi bacterium AL-N5]|nr:hypothetical protein [Chloroflexi bacterium AL-N5]